MFDQLLAAGFVRIETRGRRAAVASWITVVAAARPASSLDSAALVPEINLDHVEISSVLPRPEDWMAHGVCAQIDSSRLEDIVAQDEFFFGGQGVGNILPPKKVAMARSFCAPCPVVEDCLIWALEHDERFGIWGGTTGRDREKYRAKIRRGETTPQQIAAERLGGA